MRSSGFSDSGEQSAYALTVNGASTTSFTQTLGAALSVPLRVSSTEWRAWVQAGLTHEAADSNARIGTTLLGSPLEIQTSPIGRNRLNLGLGLRGQIDKQTVLAIDVNRQSATHWDSLVIMLSLNMAF
jgi:outer membrane autotransporter protein